MYHSFVERSTMNSNELDDILLYNHKSIRNALVLSMKDEENLFQRQVFEYYSVFEHDEREETK